MYPNYALPILDLNEEESQSTDFNLNTLLYINSELIEKFQKAAKKKNKSGKDSKGDDSSQSSQETKTNKRDNSLSPDTGKNADDNSSGGSSFEVIGDDHVNSTQEHPALNPATLLDNPLDIHRYMLTHHLLQTQIFPIVIQIQTSIEYGFAHAHWRTHVKRTKRTNVKATRINI